MKTFKWFILATSTVALLSCSTNYAPSIEDDSSLDIQTRGSETSQNDSTDGGVSATFDDWVVVISDTIVATEVPKDEAKNDSIPNDSTKID